METIAANTVDITNRKAVNNILDKIKGDEKPLWGIMTPQHAIEHLATIVQYSNGKKQVEQRTTAEEAEAIKQKMIYSDMEIPQGLKSPLLPEGLDALQHGSLDEAKQALNKELDDFGAYHEANPGAVFTQPRMGPLTGAEWTVLHNKHFNHHFKQFGLI